MRQPTNVLIVDDDPDTLGVVASRDARLTELRDLMHRLATVMSAILSSVELLEDAQADPDELRAITAKAVHSVERGSALVRRLNRVVGSLD